MEDRSFDYWLSVVGLELAMEIEKHVIFKVFKPEEDIMQQGQYPRFLPILIKGCVKIYSSEDGQQVLLYNLVTNRPSIISVVNIYVSMPIEFSMFSEGESHLILVPIYRAQEWIVKYPSFMNLYLNNFHTHYSKLLNSTRQIASYKLEERLVKYLQAKSINFSSKELKLKHRSIAEDLGTTREVISRILKKLEAEKIIQLKDRKILMI